MDAFADALADYVIAAITTTFNQILILLGPGLILVAVIHLVGQAVRNCAVTVFGPYIWTYIFKSLGTTVHELGHAIFCLVFGHKIQRIEFFKPNLETGSLGRVEYTLNPKNAYQRIGMFFVGIGPILLGTVVIYYAAIFLLGPRVFASMDSLNIDNGSFTSFQNLGAMLNDLYRASFLVLAYLLRLENLARWQFYLFVYIALSVGNSVTLSKSDLAGAYAGFLTLAGVLLAFNAATLWIAPLSNEYFVAFSRFYQSFYKVMMFALILNVIALFALLPFYLFKRYG